MKTQTAADKGKATKQNPSRDGVRTRLNRPVLRYETRYRQPSRPPSVSVQQPPVAPLRRVEDRLKAALTAGRMATWEWDPETDRITSSEYMDSLFGLPAGEVFATATQAKELLHPEDRDSHGALVEAAVRNCGAWHNEFRIVRPTDGRIIWLEERAHPVRHPGTGRMAMVGLVWDITERKCAEEALRESEARHALLIEVDDALRPLVDPGVILDAACALVARRLGNEAAAAVRARVPAHADSANGRLLREIAERVWAAADRARAEQGVRRSEEKYRALFTSIDEGFCILEVLFDTQERACDMRFLEVNPAFESITGLRDVAGHTAGEIAPGLHSVLRSQAEAAVTGIPVRFETYVTAWDRWFDVYSVRIGAASECKVASVFRDVTHRRQTERRLRYAADFDAFRVALNDALRPLDDPAQIQSAAARLLGTRLHANRVLYAEVGTDGKAERLQVQAGWPADAVDTLGTIRLAEVGGTLVDQLRAGRIVIVPNVDDERRFTQLERAAWLLRDVRAFVELPLVRAKKLVAILSIQHEQPRVWNQQDIACIEEAAQRTWAAVDRARAEAALRAWEMRLQKAFSIQTVGVLFFDLSGRVIEANAAFERMSGFRRWELLEPTPCEGGCPPRCAGLTPRAVEDLATRGETAPYEKELVRKDGTRWWGLFAPTRLSGSGAESECVEFILDITQSKKTQEELRRTREELELRVLERTAELAQTNTSLREQIAERQRAESARQELLRQLVNAQEDERRRISRELHDELGQQVSALSLKLSMLRQDATLSAPARAQVESLEKLARTTDNGLDFLVWQLRPTVLDDLGLAAAVRDHVNTWSEHFNISCRFHAPTSESMRLDPEVETVLYRAVQEALNNVAKHARARHVEVRLERGASHASLTVIDDGVGFDPCPRGERPRGLGLVGMRERASFLGGDISIASKPGEGTRIKVDVPLPSAR